jgi:hypothetical protein
MEGDTGLPSQYDTHIRGPDDSHGRGGHRAVEGGLCRDLTAIFYAAIYQKKMMRWSDLASTYSAASTPTSHMG